MKSQGFPLVKHLHPAVQRFSDEQCTSGLGIFSHPVKTELTTETYLYKIGLENISEQKAEG